MNKPDFNIDFFLKVSKGVMTPEELNKTLLELVDKGFIEQYIDEDGDFQFELTDLGREIAEHMNKINKNLEDE
jgi:predicted transcriptional regulator|tara:strand:- start:379 stop:597 length:219 start_codon:yes stop_codon:yes gene_type:complete